MANTHVEISAERFTTRLLGWDSRLGSFRLGELRAFAQMLFCKMEDNGAITPCRQSFNEWCYMNHVRPINSSFVRLFATCESSGVLLPFYKGDKRYRLADSFLEFCEQHDGGRQYLLPFSNLAVEDMKIQEEIKEAHCD